MQTKQVIRAAELRGIYFDGKRKWQNSMVGYGYSFFTPNGIGFRQADTLNGIYQMIMEFERIK